MKKTGKMHRRHRFQKAGLRLWLLLLTAALLTSTACANSFPGYYLTVQVLNCPAEPYWLCLLAPDDGYPFDFLPEELDAYEIQPEDLPPALRQAVTQHTPVGWHINDMDDDTFRHEDGPGPEWRHSLGMLTREFQPLILTQSGECWLSPALRRTVGETYVSVDWAAKTARMPPAWIAYFFNILSTVLPTLFIEGLVLLLFRYDIRKNWKVFLKVNLATQGLLWVLLGWVSAYDAGYGAIILMAFILILIEPVITAIEAVLFAKWLVGGSPTRAAFYAVTANIASCFLGFWATVRLWMWCTNTFYRLPYSY